MKLEISRYFKSELLTAKQRAVEIVVVFLLKLLRINVFPSSKMRKVSTPMVTNPMVAHYNFEKWPKEAQKI